MPNQMNRKFKENSQTIKILNKWLHQKTKQKQETKKNSKHCNIHNKSEAMSHTT